MLLEHKTVRLSEVSIPVQYKDTQIIPKAAQLTLLILVSTGMCLLAVPAALCLGCGNEEIFSVSGGALGLQFQFPVCCSI